MTEAEWLNCSDPQPMLAFIQDKASARQVRLLASACCRRLADYFKDERSRQLIDTSELYADAEVGADVLEASFDAAADAQEAIHWAGGDAVDQSAAEAVLGLRTELTFDQVFDGTFEAAGAVAASEAWEKIYGTPGRHWSETEREHEEAERVGAQAEMNAQVVLFRDVIGNPFQPVTINPAWLTPSVIAVAQAAYEVRSLPSGHLDPNRLAVLADALEEAGCTDASILAHCRSIGVHVRGCWAVDALLGKK